jgi:protoporphyrinogen oxidase
MRKVDYLILGAGPAGLTIANLIKNNKPEASFIVLEKESEAGGLCRSTDVDGSPFDIAGGHFLDVRRPKVNEFLFGFMPEEEWNVYDRDSRIDMKTYEIGHPFEANIWQMPQEEQVEYIKSIAVAGCNLGQPKPEGFVEWITWKLGEKIAKEYMLPYNGKMFGGELDKLGTYWLDKLPNVSFDDTLLSCLNKKPYGTQPGHARFYYPKKYGYGELWLRMGKALGDALVCNATVDTIDVNEKVITCEDGSSYAAGTIITTIPWTCFKEIKSCDETIKASISRLKHTGTEIKYVPEDLDTAAHWIYVPAADVSYHRILVRHNFCEGSKGYWVETNMNRVEKDDTSIKFDNEYTYPLNTIDKPAVMAALLPYMRSHGIIGLGRWGEHEHYNSDRTVERAMELAEEIL